jgi:hypothetical protein
MDDTSLSRSPLTLPVEGHGVPLPAGDEGLLALLALRPAYVTIAKLLRSGSADVAGVIAWARSLHGDQAQWQARTHLLLAVYSETFSKGVPCAAVLGAVRAPEVVAALRLSPDEIRVYTLLGGGFVADPVGPDDGLRYFFTRDSARDSSNVRLRDAAVHAMAIALGIPRGRCYAYMICFEHSKAAGNSSHGLGSDAGVPKDVRFLCLVLHPLLAIAWRFSACYELYFLMWRIWVCRQCGYYFTQDGGWELRFRSGGPFDNVRRHRCVNNYWWVT